jgi:hypothetical protein
MAAPLLDADWREQSRNPGFDSEILLRVHLREGWPAPVLAAITPSTMEASR